MLQCLKPKSRLSLIDQERLERLSGVISVCHAALRIGRRYHFSVACQV
jgi:hypothetical protein